MTVNGDHSDHTKYSDGTFKHPFLTAPKDVSTIHYPDNKTFSVKLKRTPGISKHSSVTNQHEMKNSHKQNRRVMSRNPVRQVWSDFKHAFLGFESTFYNMVLYNYRDFWYQGKVYMGSTLQEQEIIWDTGSDYYYTQSDFCSDCSGTIFDTTQSSTFSIVPGAPTDTITYGDGTTLSGTLSTDMVCIFESTDSCADYFPFYAIYE